MRSSVQSWPISPTKAIVLSASARAPIGEDFTGSIIQVLEGADKVPGLAAARETKSASR